MSERASSGDEFDRGKCEFGGGQRDPWRPARWREGKHSGRRGTSQRRQQRRRRGSGSLVHGVWRRKRALGRRFQGLPGSPEKETRGGELRRSVEEGRGASKGWSGAREIQAGQAVLQMAAQGSRWVEKAVE